MEMRTGVGLIMDVVSVLTTFLVLAVAIGAAAVMTKRRQLLAGSWLLVVGRLGVWFTTLCYLALNSFLVPAMGFDVAQWFYIAVKLVLLLSGLIVAIALILMNPRKVVSHG